MIETADFFYKIKDINELTKLNNGIKIKKEKYLIIKTIELNKEEFDIFCSNFLAKYDFVSDNFKKSSYLNSIKKVLEIKNENQSILVFCDEYPYARFVGIKE